ncbi:NUDIX domain-containing protein [Phytoactinopolyspora halotolerans]|uniref:NUDIX domain-containing protein n=1 Tax=Phytoactinopolyspora halotolerans TaxID=1981512 RepID=A0A6L9S9K1_9ACTN|nr:NUDIX domain-containing protein [Phytoactinopolyspora halotolerans]
MWTRQAARVILIDGVGRVLLLRGFDVDDPARHWWFTPGGGLEPGEDPRRAAAREVREESGLAVDESQLRGPVAERSASFRYFGRPCRQDEALFYARLVGSHDVSDEGWTQVERASVSEIRWWDVDELVASEVTVYPPALPDLARMLGADAWDGVRRVID